MPEISRFYGIVIRMFFGDHPPKHIHAEYGDKVGVFDIETGEMIQGDMSKRSKKLVKEWILINSKALVAMWEKQEISQLPPLV